MRILSNLNISGFLDIDTINNAAADTDKFLVADANGVVKFRTGAEVASDIGASVGYVSTVKHEVKLGEAIAKGQAVYVTSSDGTNMIVSKASNVADVTSSKTLGLLETGGAANAKVFVITEGLLAGLDTSTATAGAPVWLGTDGNLLYGLAAKPVAPAHMVFIGIVTRVNANNGEIFVKVQNGFELEELHNVLITGTPVDKAVIQYDTATGLWKNSALSGVTGSGTTNYLPKFTGTSTLGNSLVYDDGTNVGIGTTTPSTRLTVNGGVTSSAFTRVNLNGSDTIGAGAFTALYNTAFTTAMLQQLNANNGLDWWTLASGIWTKRMTFTADGNIALGVTPFSWAAGTKAIDFGSGSAIWNPGSVTNTYITTNAYYDITDNRWEYKGTGSASNYHQFGNEHRWNIAASGTANNPITFTQAMTLDANGRLGIGTTAPSTRLHIYGIGGGGPNGSNLTMIIEDPTGLAGQNKWGIGTRIAPNMFAIQDLYANATRLVINESGNVGIGTTTPYSGTFVTALDINALAYPTLALSVNGTYVAGILGLSNSIAINSKTGYISFQPNDTERMRLDVSGNLGLGVTPSAWRNIFNAFQVGYTGALYALTVSNATEQVNLASNYYQNSAGNELRIQSGFATRYQQASGEHRWATAATSTANSGITFTQSMTLDASGRLLLGTTSASTNGLLQINGDLGFQGNRTVRIASNSDGETLTYLGTRLAISNVNSFTYGYADASLIASVANSDNLLLIDSGRYSGATISRFRVSNTTLGDTSFSLTRGASTTFFASTLGNVGIGTAAPTVRLHVMSALNSDVAIFSGANLDRGLKISTAIGIQSDAIVVLNAQNTYGEFAFHTASSEKMRLTTAGNLGIGTTVPVTNLQLHKATAELSGLQVTNLTTGSSITDGAFFGIDNNQAYVWNYENNATVFGTNNTERMRIASTGAVRFNSYGTGARTGTVAYNLAVDASGNIIETAGGVVDGSGTATYIPKWQDANTLTNSIISENSNLITIQGSLSIRPISGLSGYITFTEDSVADRWAMGVTTGDGNFYFRYPYPSSTALLSLTPSGNLGLGVTPSAWTTGNSVRALQMDGGSFFVYNGDSLWMGQNIHITPSLGNTYTKNGAASYYIQSTGSHLWVNAPSGTAGASLTGTVRMTLDASGNLGLGVTPSAWAATRAIQVGLSGSIANRSGGNGFYMSSNLYFSADPSNTAANGVYINSDFATTYLQANGAHRWYNAPSGTAGTPVSFTQAMTLDASGRLGIGTTSPSARLEVSGGRTYLGSSDGYELAFTRTGNYFYIYNDGGGVSGKLTFTTTTGITEPILTLTQNTRNVIVGGTSDAGFKLDVNGTMRVSGASTFGATLQITGASGTPTSGAGLELAGNTTTGSITSFNRSLGTYLPLGFNVLSYSFSTSGTERFSIANSGAATFTSSGSFGNTLQIAGGTTAPTSGAGLELAGGSTTSGVTSFNRNLGTYLPLVFNTLSYSFLTSGTEKFAIANSGAATFSSSVTAGGNITLATNNTYIYGKDNAGNIPRLLGINSGNSTYIGPIDAYAGGEILYAVSANVTNQRFYTGASERMRITSGGSTILAYSGPDTGELLQVYGTMKVTGAATFSSTVTATRGLFGTTTFNASAILQADSTTQGFLPPRMTSTQRAAISTPSVGLVVYQTDGTEGLYIYTNASGWKSLAIVN